MKRRNDLHVREIIFIISLLNVCTSCPDVYDAEICMCLHFITYIERKKDLVIPRMNKKGILIRLLYRALKTFRPENLREFDIIHQALLQIILMLDT